jgi:hypothetical protein
MRLCLLWLCVSLGAALCNLSPSPQDRRSDKSVVRVGTFNLLWLFGDDMSGSPWTSDAARQEHINKVAEQILRTQVDVLAVHEVQDCDVLGLLVGRLGPAFRYYLIPGKDTATKQNSALVTKIDPVGSLRRTDARASYPVSESGCPLPQKAGSSGVSKHAIARIKTTNLVFDFVFGHLKSGRQSTDCYQREAQAQVLRNYLDENGGGVSTIIAGDLNDRDASFPDKYNNVGSSKTLRILKVTKKGSS